MTASILAAYDPFTNDPAPLDLAVAVHLHTEAPLIVAAVAPVHEIVAGVGETRSRQLVEAAERRLAGIRLGVPFTTELLYDTSTPRALNKAAEEENAALIVIGSTHRSAAGRVLPGSTAERLLHGAPCAVALAPSGYRRRKLDTIAVGFADTAEGREALSTAHALAARSGAKLRVISVLRSSDAIADAIPQPSPPARGDDLERRARAERARVVDDAVAALPAGVEIETEFHVGDAADVLLRVSEHVDALVCGSRGYGPLRSVLLGGVSRRIVDGAQCPVLVLPRGIERPLAALLGSSSAATTP